MASAAAHRRRIRLLLTVLAYTNTRFVTEQTPALARALGARLDTWAGVGRIVHGMIRLGYDVQLTRYGERGWRATFFPAGIAHSLTSAVGSVFAPTPWRAVQGAALVTLAKADATG